jgi:hypothetical protein
MIQRIEVDFAIPVELTDDEMQTLCDMVQRIAKRHQPEGFVHWQSGVGDKPIFSKTDCAIFGWDPQEGAKDSGEPDFDDSILHIETTCRERYEGEKG